MGSNAATTLIRDAQIELFSELETECLCRYWDRFKNPIRFLRVLADFDRCQFWRDEGFLSVWEWGLKKTWRNSAEEWKGWGTLARIPSEDLDTMVLIRDGTIKPEAVAPLVRTLNADNYRSWITLALYLNPEDLRKAVKSWHRLAHSGYEGDTIFVPVWMPKDEYRRIFSDRSSVTARPWDQIRDHFKKASEDR